MARAKPKAAHGEDRWRKQVNFDIEYAKRRLFDEGDVSPMFMVHTDDGLVVVGTGWGDDDNKDAVFLYMRCLCLAHDAIGLSFVSEAWARSVSRAARETEAEYEARAHAIRPSEAEDRREVILAEVSFRDGAGGCRSLLEQREIVRGADGRPSGVTDGGLPKVAKYRSHWAALVPTEPVPAPLRRAAETALPVLAKRLGLAVKDVARNN